MSTTANHPFPPPPPSKRRRKLVPPPPASTTAAAEEGGSVVSAEAATDLLNRSLAVIMESVGFSAATALAQERIRQIAEEHYLSMLRTISTFAAAQRRTKPTIIDFEEMLAAHGVPLRSLEEEMNRFPSKRHLFILAPPSSNDGDTSETTLAPAAELLGPELLGGGGGGGGGVVSVKGVESHHPPFPSRHTYLATPVFTQRPTDPRLIRERATEEARLAESALRKFLAVGAKKRAGGDDDDLATGDCLDAAGNKSKSKRRIRDEAWRTVFDRLANDATFGTPNGAGAGAVAVKVEPPADGEGIVTPATGAGGAMDANADGETAFMEVIVNADIQHWRKSGGRKRAFV